MKGRSAVVERETNETKIRVELEIDGSGAAEVSMGVGFFDHMLCLFAKHGLFDLKVSAQGDLQVDDHHTIEDVGIALGEAFRKALGEKKGVQRYGFFELPMDESLARVAVDLSGRSCCVFKARFARELVGGMSTEMAREFFHAFARGAECCVHARVAYGKNDHHKIEALFKALGKALKAACAIEQRAPDAIPSTKGRL